MKLRDREHWSGKENGTLCRPRGEDHPITGKGRDGDLGAEISNLGVTGGRALEGWIRRFLEVMTKKQRPGLRWVRDWGLPTHIPQAPKYLCVRSGGMDFWTWFETIFCGQAFTGSDVCLGEGMRGILSFCKDFLRIHLRWLWVG